MAWAEARGNERGHATNTSMAWASGGRKENHLAFE